MTTLQANLYIVALVVLGIVTCTVCLKIVVWALNGTVYGTDPAKALPSLSFMRSTIINLATFGVIAALGYACILYLNYIPRADSFKYGVSIEWAVIYAGFVYSVFVFWRMLPTTFWRALVVAIADWTLLFLVGGVYFFIMMVIAFSGHKN
ncbi:MAG: hypothetical protein WCT04_06815 [Planctomycetota bacterium]